MHRQCISYKNIPHLEKNYNLYLLRSSKGRLLLPLLSRLTKLNSIIQFNEGFVIEHFSTSNQPHDKGFSMPLQTLLSSCLKMASWSANVHNVILWYLHLPPVSFAIRLRPVWLASLKRTQNIPYFWVACNIISNINIVVTQALLFPVFVSGYSPSSRQMPSINKLLPIHLVRVYLHITRAITSTNTARATEK